MNSAGSGRLDKIAQRIAAHGYGLQFQEYCECADTPGFLGQIRGVTDRNKRLVRISTAANRTTAELEEIMLHELRHLDEPEWDCGNRDVLGRGGRNE